MNYLLLLKCQKEIKDARAAYFPGLVRRTLIFCLFSLEPSRLKGELQRILEPILSLGYIVANNPNMMEYRLAALLMQPLHETMTFLTNCLQLKTCQRLSRNTHFSFIFKLLDDYHVWVCF